VSRLRVAFLCAAVVVFVTTAALWPAKPSIEEKLLDRFDQELGLIPRFIGAKPTLPCEREGNTAPPVFCPGERKTQLSEKELILEAREARESGRERPRFLRNLLRAELPEDRENLQRELEDRIEENPNSPELLNDLAVVHLIRAGKGEEPAGYAEAFDLLNRATQAADPPPEALFNQEFALISFGLRHEARRMSVRLAASESPDWDNLALGLLAPTNIPTNNDSARWRASAEVFLGEWGKLTVAQKAVDAQAKLEAARKIAQTLANQKGDYLLVDSVKAIDEADLRTKHRLARGHAAFFEARDTKIYADCEKKALLWEAQSAFEDSSPFGAWVHLDDAICGYFERDFLRSEAHFNQIRQILQGKPYHALRGREGWVRGLVRVRQGRFGEAENAYEEASKSFNNVGERSHGVAIASLRALNFEQIGAVEEAWDFRMAVLSDLGYVSDQVRIYDHFEAVILSITRQRRFDLARFFLAEQLSVAQSAAAQSARNLDLPGFVLAASVRLAIDSGTFSASEPKEQLKQAYLALARLPLDHPTRNRQQLDLAVIRSLLNPEDRAAGIEAIDRALAFFKGQILNAGDRIHVLRLIRDRAMFHELTGDILAAHRDLENGLEEIDWQRAQVREPENRVRFLAAVRSIVEQKLRIEIDSLKDPWRALHTIETNSNRLLLDELPRAKPFPYREDIEEFKRAVLALSPDRLVVRYGHLPSRLLTWSIYQGQLEFQETPVNSNGLLKEIQNCRRASELGMAQVENACHTTAELLIPRAWRSHPETQAVQVITDDLVDPAPFPALISKYGIKNSQGSRTLTFSPGLLVSIYRARNRLSTDSALSRPLFVLNPAFPKTFFPSLLELKVADSSLASFAKIFPDAQFLVGPAATKHAVLEALKTATFLHFEGHAVVDPIDPARSGLVLASDRDDMAPLDSVLTALDLSQDTHPHLRFAVLGGCSTAPKYYSASADSAGLALQMLLQGVSRVLVSVTPLQDSKAAVELSALYSEPGVDLSYPGKKEPPYWNAVSTSDYRIFD
jgi:hypothetical protein